MASNEREREVSETSETRSAHGSTPTSGPAPSGKMRSDSFSDETVLFSDVKGTTRLGRYLVEGVLGVGGFGTVFRAMDEQLKRLVAVKVPHAHKMVHEAHKSLYLAEAQTLASLDHPRVVPIYDYGVLDDGRCYVVSKLIDGRSLSQVIAESPIQWKDAVPLLISIARTLNYVHSCKLIHRDIKPGNLLQARDGQVFVADFGLAMHEAHVDSHQAGAGTLNYMSPEQAGGEGHRIDSRSDLFSLGVVMYEMLTGVKPFKGADSTSTLENVITKDPLPITTMRPEIPNELNRICLKLLSKRAAERYQTGQELADDLQYFQDQQSGAATVIPTTGAPLLESHSLPDVMPRGLRSYEGQHAYFFLQLLPGPYDRDGLPESLSHWVRWVRRGEVNPELHRIGVIAGPSGCGKSSLVKAGLIPLLARESISTVMIEASIDRTESQLASALNTRFPELTSEKSLSDKIAAIRRGQAIPEGKEVLIVIDQFEQWLHANQDREHADLIRALRQCDGQRVQCIVLVRDDFWLALNRFMEAVEAPLVVGENVTMVDLFDLPHASEVLTKFGRAFGRISKDSETVSPQTQEFIRQSIDYVARDGKVFPVHLSLFSEMVKSRDWVPETLKELGGSVGMGLQFLRESFSVAHAPPLQRMHEEAVRRTLESLLPDVGTEIKTQWRTRDQLAEISGYANDPKSFQSLLKVLEGDLKLISPIDTLERTRSSAEVRTTESRFQLSHDFLVPSIREWLYSEQRKTLRGRCQLLLTEQAANWSKQPIPRNLPLWSDWVMYRGLLSSSLMSASERKMLKVTDRHRGIQTMIGLGIMLLVWVGFQNYGSWKSAQSLTQQLLTTGVATAPSIVDDMMTHRRYAPSAVARALGEVPQGTPQELNLRLAELRWNPQAAERLLDLALSPDTGDVEAITSCRTALVSHASQCTRRCWENVTAGSAVDATDEQKQLAFRSLLVLAQLDPPQSQNAARWNGLGVFLSEQVLDWIQGHPNRFDAMVAGLEPVARVVIPELRKPTYLGVVQPNDRSRWAILLLQRYLESDLEERTRLTLDAAAWQRPYLMPPRRQIKPEWIRQAIEADQLPAEELLRDHRLAIAEGLLLSISPTREDWNILKRCPKPGARSQLIDEMAGLELPLKTLEDQIESETDPGILSAVLLSLGNYPQARTLLSAAARNRVQELYETHPDAGVHSAARWLMVHCQLPIPDDRIVTTGTEYKSRHQWRLTPEGHLFVRIDARNVEGIHRVFEIGAMEVTVDQCLKWLPDKYYHLNFAQTHDCPINVVLWPETIRYCEWLSLRHGIPREEFCCPAELPEEVLGGISPDPSKTSYRMPTVAEWQLACRAGVESQWYFGSDPHLMAQYCWFYDNSKVAGNGNEDLTASHPVGLLKPNDLGLFDMLGNVREWTADTPPNVPENRCIVSGSHAYLPLQISMTSAPGTPTNTQFNTLGFRIARTIPDSELHSIEAK